jgi:uncharacterized protein Veg
MSSIPSIAKKKKKKKKGNLRNKYSSLSIVLVNTWEYLFTDVTHMVFLVLDALENKFSLHIIIIVLNISAGRD